MKRFSITDTVGHLQYFDNLYRKSFENKSTFFMLYNLFVLALAHDSCKCDYIMTNWPLRPDPSRSFSAAVLCALILAWRSHREISNMVALRP
jgi:hypothetical protein